MNANFTLGGFPQRVPTVRLGGIAFAGDFDNISLLLSSADIRYYQNVLNQLPTTLPRLTIDGVVGTKTAARIKEFQQQNNLALTGALDTTTKNLLAAKSFALKNPITPIPILSSGERDTQIRALVLQSYNAIRNQRPDCSLSSDGMRIICPDKTISAGTTDSIADWLPGGAKANAVIDQIVGVATDVAKAGAQGFGQGAGFALPTAFAVGPVLWIGGAVIGIIVLKKVL